MKFIDEASLTVSSGKGGAGAVSFRREAKVPRGGPDGGDGGRGGNIYFCSTDGKNSLLDFKYNKSYQAPHGQAGSGSQQTGANGQDLYLEVPVGTQVKDSEGNLLLDLNEPGDFLFLKGGRGGKGNAFFKSSVNQAPERSQPGEAGESREIHLELKLLADVALVGFPNAGKSTLISVISAAKPKVADYPFTTLVPHLGVVRFDEERSFVVADIPGLIEGAHRGVGLGIQFLRHIERTRVLLHLIDLSEIESEMEVWDRYQKIRYELGKYDKAQGTSPPLLERPQIVALNKADVVDEAFAEKVYELFQNKSIPVYTISAVAGKSVNRLVKELGRQVFE